MLVRDLLDKIDNKEEVVITFKIGVVVVKGGKKEYKTQTIKYNDFDTYDRHFIPLENGENITKENINNMRVDKINLIYIGYESGDHYIDIAVKHEK